jgi:hypothetical protein
MSTKAIGEMIGVLFLSRDITHRAHLATSSYAEHMALGSFYEEVIPLADSLAEACQGRGEKITDIPYYSDAGKAAILPTLKRWLAVVESTRMDCYPEDTALQNIIDEIVGLYLSTIYKLTFLK